MMGAWIDLKSRKLTGLPDEFLNSFESMEKAEDFKILTKEDTRKHVQVPKDIEIL